MDLRAGEHANHIYFGETIPVAEFVNLEEVVEFMKSKRPVKVQLLDGKPPSCGGCGVTIGSGMPYCWNCGRMVKWDD